MKFADQPGSLQHLSIHSRTARMFDQLKQRWRDFRAAPSGTRFRGYHSARVGRPHGLRSVLVVLGGTLLILVGIAMLVLPGPGLVAIVIGAGLIAGESLVAARLLDRIDQWANAKLMRWRRPRR